MDVRQPKEFDAKVFFRGLTAEQLAWLGKKENHDRCKNCPFNEHPAQWFDIMEACGYDRCIIEFLHDDWWKKDGNGEGN